MEEYPLRDSRHLHHCSDHYSDAGYPHHVCLRYTHADALSGQHRCLVHGAPGQPQSPGRKTAILGSHTAFTQQAAHTITFCISSASSGHHQRQCFKTQPSPLVFSPLSLSPPDAPAITRQSPASETSASSRPASHPTSSAPARQSPPHRSACAGDSSSCRPACESTSSSRSAPAAPSAATPPVRPQ